MDRRQGFAAQMLVALALWTTHADAQPATSEIQTVSPSGATTVLPASVAAGASAQPDAPAATVSGSARAASASAPAEAESSKQPPAGQRAEVEPAVQEMPAASMRLQRRASVELALQHAQRAREDTSALAPWLLTAAGVAAMVVGLSVGVGNTLSCKTSCTTAFWPGWTVVAGTTLTTAGIVWLEIRERNISELERRRHQLEQELERLDWNAAGRLPPAKAHASLAWRQSF